MVYVLSHFPFICTSSVKYKLYKMKLFLHSPAIIDLNEIDYWFHS